MTIKRRYQLRLDKIIKSKYKKNSERGKLIPTKFLDYSNCGGENIQSALTLAKQ